MNIVNYLARCSISGVNRGTEINPDFKIQQYRCCKEYTVVEDGSVSIDFSYLRSLLVFLSDDQTKR